MTTDHLYLSLHPHWQDSQPVTMARASQLLNFTFLPFLTFKNWTIEKQVKMLCAREKKKKQISPLAQWLGSLHKQDLITPPMPPIAVCWINSHIGYGVFARDTIPAWTYIGEYTGILRHRQSIWMDENDYCFRYPLSLRLWRYFTIDSGSHGNFTRFINHSDHPNVEAISAFHGGFFHIIIRTTRTIRAGEELCYHYGPLYWKHRKKREEFLPEEE